MTPGPSGSRNAFRDLASTIRLAALALAGPRYWLLPLAPMAWIAVLVVLLLTGRLRSFDPVSAQNVLIGGPLVALAAFLGIGTIASEIDERTLEIAYTAPGGAHRVWLAKLAAAALMVLVSLLLLGALTFTFLTPFPIVQTLYGAGQTGIFYLAAAMGLSTLVRSEAGGGLATLALVGLEAVLASFVGRPPRVSPFWNPLSVEGADAEQLFAMAIQNRIGMALAIAAIVALTFARAERREKMLSG